MRSKKTFMIACLVSSMVLCSCKNESKENMKNNTMPAESQENTVVTDTVNDNTVGKNAVDAKAEKNNDPAYLQDAKELVNTLEETHIAFGIDAVPKAYDAAKEEYLKNAADTNISSNKFLMETKKFLTSMADGHTCVYSEKPYNYAAINGTFIDNELWLMDQETYEKRGKIIEIGKVKTADLFKVIDACYPAENETARDENYAYYIEDQPVLEYAGCEFDDRGIDIVVEGEKGTSTVHVPWRNTGDESNNSTYEETANMESKIMDDVLYVDWNSCMLDDAEFNSNVKTLKSALEDGITKVIIDMRDNGGGNASYCREYLKQLGMQAPEYSAVFRHSPLSAKQRGETKTSGVDRESGDSVCVQNDKIKLVVLVNERTFSAATMLAVYVQDGKLGTVIGRKSSNSPTCYSDVVTLDLKNSGLIAQMSTSYLARPDAKADQKSLDPDIETEMKEDSLETAKEFLKK